MFSYLLRDDCCLSFLCSLKQLSCEKKRYVTTQTTALLSVVGGYKIEDSQETCMNLLYIFI